MYRPLWAVFVLAVFLGLAYLLRLRMVEFRSAPLSSIHNASQLVNWDEKVSPGTYGSRTRRVSAENLTPKAPSAVHVTHIHHLDPSDLHVVNAPFIDGSSMTIILPVTFETFNDLDDILQPLLVDESSVHAIIITCPPGIFSFLQSSLLSSHGGILSDVFVLPWAEDSNEDLAMAHAVSQVTTEWVLLLGSEGLARLDTESIDLLLNPLSITAPVGPCGLVLSTYETLFSASTGGSQPVSFLIPPFVAPTNMMQTIDEDSVSGSGTWKNLGKRIAQGRGDGVGGFMLRTGDSDQEWCLAGSRRATLEDMQDNGLVTANGLFLSEQDLSTVDKSFQAFNQSMSLVVSNTSVFAIFLPSLQSLENFSSTVCRMFERGYEAKILLTSDWNVNDLVQRNTRRSSHLWQENNLISKRCEMPFSFLDQNPSQYAMAEAASAWLTTVADSPSVVISSINHDSVSLLEYEIRRRLRLGTVIVNIPEEDLAYSEWVGTLTLNEWKNWNTPNVEISIVTNDRPSSLLRLLSSLRAARLFGDTVDLRINMEQTANEETQQLVNEFEWNHGKVFIHRRVVHGGLLPAVVESWYPRSDDSYGVILEDDVELSPLFYAWTKLSLLRFRYGASVNRSPSMFGISLYQQKNIELRPEGRKPFNPRALFDAHGYEHLNTPYLSQIPCSWGAVYFPEHWREFHSYLAVRFSEVVFPIDEAVVPHLRSNKWSKSWKKFFIELVYLRGYVMLYPNYDNFVSLSTNHLEVGSHVKSRPSDIYNEKKSLFNLPLMVLPNGTDPPLPSGTLLDLPHERMPPWSQLPVLDLVGSVSSEMELITRGQVRQHELTGCDTIASSSTMRRTSDARELFMCTADE